MHDRVAVYWQSERENKNDQKSPLFYFSDADFYPECSGTVDDAIKKSENGLERIYDDVRRPFKRLYLNRAVTQNYLQGLFKISSLKGH